MTIPSGITCEHVISGKIFLEYLWFMFIRARVI